jgi:pentapeptide repeat protein
MRAEKMKRSAVTMPVQQKVNHTDTAIARTDVVRLLQEVGSPEQLDVSGQDLRGISLMNFNLRGANMSQARLCEANLCGANLCRADLHGADLRGTSLCWADLRGANLYEADLRGADLSWADLQEADLRGVNLDMTNLYGASLCKADLRGAPLDKTDLRGADLSWASFGGASTFERTRSHLRRRGAIFREKTKVIVAERFSEKACRYALGFALGLPPHEHDWLSDGSRHKVHMHTHAAEKTSW